MLYITRSLLIFNNLILFIIDNKWIIYSTRKYSKKINMMCMIFCSNQSR